MKLRIATYNIHKGVMGLRKPTLTIHALREQIHAMDADLVFLQEVQGRHDKHAGKFDHWPDAGQHEFLAQSPSAIDDLLGHASQQYFTAYGMNAVYSHGHHGNALLSRYEIEWMLNQDVSDHRLEQRGLLHCRVKTPVGPIHAMVAHFGLLYRSRVRQANKLIEHVGTHVPAGMPLVVAGDFNDWQRRLGPILQQGLQADEVLEGRRQAHGLARAVHAGVARRARGHHHVDTIDHFGDAVDELERDPRGFADGRFDRDQVIEARGLQIANSSIDDGDEEALARRP